MANELVNFDLLTPIPDRWTHYLIRGFSTTKITANNISKLCNVPTASDCLSWRKEPPEQKCSGIQKRRSQLKNSMKAQGCLGLNCLIVDDVFATGSTVNEAARALYEAGAQNVSAFCLAYQAKQT